MVLELCFLSLICLVSALGRTVRKPLFLSFFFFFVSVEGEKKVLLKMR